MQPSSAFTISLLALTTALVAQSYVVAPAAATNDDLLSYEWVAGASQPLRQQILVGQSHLLAMLGRPITAIELRRTAAPEAYLPGNANLTVTLSTSPNAPLGCDNHYAGNVGPDATQVFAGTVSFPASPATGVRMTPVPWSPANIVRIQFAQPFVYLGGTLCVDLTGQPIPGQEANWWMADAAEEVMPGTAAVEIGAGCGPYGGPQHAWSEVAHRSLVPGGRAQFRAKGPANGMALAVFGGPAPSPIPLGAFGIATPNCFCHLDPGAIFAAVAAVYVPETHPLALVSAHAEVLVPLPADVSWFGVQLSTQWFDLTQLTTSNAFTWTIGNAIPTLDMALNEGHPGDAKGWVTTYLAPVLRFEFQ